MAQAHFLGEFFTAKVNFMKTTVLLFFSLGIITHQAFGTSNERRQTASRQDLRNALQQKIGRQKTQAKQKKEQQQRRQQQERAKRNRNSNR